MRLTIEGRARRRVTGACLSLALAILALGVALPGGAARGAADVRANEVIVHRGGGVSGPSQSWSLGPDQPFLAVPFTGESPRRGGAIAVGADVGVLLFEAPFFAGVDETCEYRLAGAEEGGRWRWEAVTALPAPGARGAVEASLPPRGTGSLIVYRRAFGPPPGILLLERRRYINWACEAPTKARGYKRLFVPMAAAPHRTGCFNMKTALATGAGSRVELDFSAASEVLLLLPGDLDPAHAAMDHRLAVSLFDAAECAGTSVRLALAPGAPRHVALEAHDFDRATESVLIRYEAGAFDPMLAPAGEAPTAEAPADENPTADEAQEREMAGESPTAPVDPAAPESTPTEPSSTGSKETSTTQTAIAAPDEPAEERPAPDPAATDPAPAAADPDPPEPAPREAAEPADPDLLETMTESPPPEPEEPSLSAAAGSEPAAPMATEETVAETAKPEAPAVGETAGAAEPEANATLAVVPAAEEPPPAEETEAAPPVEEGQAGLLSAPEPASEREPSQGAQTFKYPLLQGYRLSACLYEREACGEPAASEWCRARGFARAADWTIDENIGSLFPTLAIGDLQLCASYVCHGFVEITCAP